MKNVLVPTDFSATAENAASYAIALAKHYGAQKIVLYNAYQAPVVTEPTMPAIQVVDFETLKSISEGGLQHLKNTLASVSDSSIEIEVISEFGSVDVGLSDVCSNAQADLIVIGTAGGSQLEEMLTGSTALHVARHAPVPVIMVPPQTAFRPINNVALACDLKQVHTSLPAEAIRAFLQLTNARLSIVHISEREEDEADYTIQKAMLNKLFDGFEPSISLISHPDFVEGLHAFATDNNIDVILTIPKKHGFFENLFRRNHTRQLAFHTTIPVMCMHVIDEQ